MPFDVWREEFAKPFPVDPEFSSLASNTFSYLEHLNPSVKSVIVENEYVDMDYSAAYSHFYSYLFRPPPRSSTRHLFFTKQLGDLADLPRIILRQELFRIHSDLAD